MRTRQIACALARGQSLGDEDQITISTPVVDLMKDRIFPMNMDTETYMSGPRAVNFAHDHNRLPVARTMYINKTPAGIRVSFRWRQDEDSRKVRDAFDDGVLGASVEFTVPDGGAVPNEHGGWDFTRSILTGWAFTGNPANPHCVKIFKGLGWSPRHDPPAMIEEPTLEVIDWFAPDLRSEARIALAIREGVQDGVTQAFGPDYVELEGWESVKQEDGWTAQSIIFPKAHWDSADACHAWLREHDFRSDKVDETDESWRYRQRDPEDFQRLRTLCLMPQDERPGSDACRVQAVGGPLKGGM